MIAGWMLDAPTCSSMALGDPKVTVTALCNLHQLLIDRHLRGNCQDDSTIVREKRNGQGSKRRSSNCAVAAVDAISDKHGVRRHRASGDERGTAHKGDHATGEFADAGCRHRHGKGA
jgi:hypothetical protein